MPPRGVEVDKPAAGKGSDCPDSCLLRQASAAG